EALPDVEEALEVDARLGLVLHLLGVGARREGLLRGGADAAADAGARVERFDRLDALGLHRAAQPAERLGAGERDYRDAAGLLDQDALELLLRHGHGVLLLRPGLRPDHILGLPRFLPRC